MAKKVQHLIDIIIPSYNRKQLLKRAVSSVYQQTYQNWRLFIVDDGSTDGTHEEKYGNKSQLFRLRQNKGVSYARNYGIKQGQAEWLAFLDSDDEWQTHKLEKQIEYSYKNPNYSLIHCNELWIKNGKLLNQKKRHKKQGGRIFISSVDLCCISPSAVLVKREVFDELGFFKEHFPVCEDYDFWLRFSSRYEVGFLDFALVLKYGGHSDQLSKKYFAMDYWRVKALFPFLTDENLSPRERTQVKQVLIKKTEILLKGYKKHNNFANYAEIEKIHKSLYTDSN